MSLKISRDEISQLGRMNAHYRPLSMYNNNWKDWDDDLEDENVYDRVTATALVTEYSMRALAVSTGISKSEVSLALKRCYNVNLAKIDMESDLPQVNSKALLEFIVHGLRYVFPAKKGEITRGIATASGAPILQGKIMTAGELISVWPDAHRKTKGQALQPLYKTVPKAVRRDPLLYGLLALTDAIRIGSARERNLAIDQLNKLFEQKHG